MTLSRSRPSELTLISPVAVYFQPPVAAPLARRGRGAPQRGALLHRGRRNSMRAERPRPRGGRLPRRPPSRHLHHPAGMTREGLSCSGSLPSASDRHGRRRASPARRDRRQRGARGSPPRRRARRRGVAARSGRPPGRDVVGEHLESGNRRRHVARPCYLTDWAGLPRLFASAGTVRRSGRKGCSNAASCLPRSYSLCHATR